MKPEEFTEKVLAFLGTMGVKATKPKFYVEINFDAKGKPTNVYSSATDTVIRIQIFPTQWEFLALKPKKESCARFYADDEPYISDDELGLFTKTPTIDKIPRSFAKPKEARRHVPARRLRPHQLGRRQKGRRRVGEDALTD